MSNFEKRILWIACQRKKERARGVNKTSVGAISIAFLFLFEDSFVRRVSTERDKLGIIKRVNHDGEFDPGSG